MNNLIKKILKEFIEGGEGDKALSNKEVRLFKHLNDKKQELGTKDEIIKYVQMMLKLMGKSPGEARAYYQAYTQNFRPEGDYENLTKDEFKNFRDFAQKKTTNTSAWEYSTALMPFKGSNLEGIWDDNSKGEWYYVVKSYQWYPIYLYKEDKWFGVDNYYSSSTSKQMSNSRPRVWSENLGNHIISVTTDEIKSLINGKSFGDIERERYTKFRTTAEVGDYEHTKTKTFGWGDDRIKATFKVGQIDTDDDNATFNIDIKKAGKVEGTNKLAPFEGEYPEEFKQKLEEYLKEYIKDLYGRSLRNKNVNIVVNY